MPSYISNPFSKIPHIHICTNPKYSKYEYQSSASSLLPTSCQITFAQLHSLCGQISHDHKRISPEKSSTITMVNDVSKLPKHLIEEFIPEDISFLAAFEIVIHNRKAGYLYLLDHTPKTEKTDQFNDSAIALIESFVLSIGVLLSKHHPTWMQDQAQNAELAIDLLHHIQYPIKRVSAVANDINKHAKTLKSLLEAPPARPTTSINTGVVSSTSISNYTRARRCLERLEQSAKSFRAELKLLDDLTENSFQLHLLRSPNLSKISCEYDFILAMQRIPTFLQQASQQLSTVFKVKPHALTIDPLLSEQKQIYMHTSLLWMTLYWCYFQLLFFPHHLYDVDFHFTYRDHVSMSRRNSDTSSPTLSSYSTDVIGQGIECNIRVIKKNQVEGIASKSISIDREDLASSSIGSKSNSSRFVSLREIPNDISRPVGYDLARLKVRLLGKLSYLEINQSFKHFLTLFNVVFDRHIFDLSSLEAMEGDDLSSVAGGSLWTISLPLNISSYVATKRSRSISANEYSAKFGNHSVVQRNNSLEALLAPSVSSGSRKMKPSPKKSARQGSIGIAASNVGSPLAYSDSFSCRTTPDPSVAVQSQSHSNDEFCAPTKRLTFSLPNQPNNISLYGISSQDSEDPTAVNSPYLQYIQSLAQSMKKQDTMMTTPIKEESTSIFYRENDLNRTLSQSPSAKAKMSVKYKPAPRCSEDPSDGCKGVWRQISKFFRRADSK